MVTGFLATSLYSSSELSPVPTPPRCRLTGNVHTTYTAPPPLPPALLDTGRRVPLTMPENSHEEMGSSSPAQEKTSSPPSLQGPVSALQVLCWTHQLVDLWAPKSFQRSLSQQTPKTLNLLSLRSHASPRVGTIGFYSLMFNRRLKGSALSHSQTHDTEQSLGGQPAPQETRIRFSSFKAPGVHFLPGFTLSTSHCGLHISDTSAASSVSEGFGEARETQTR